jgi:hypothetical protein
LCTIFVFRARLLNIIKITELFEDLEGDGGVSGAFVVHGSDSTQGDGDRDDSKSDEGSKETLQTDVFAVWSNVVDVTTSTTYIRSNTDSWSAILLTLGFVAVISFISFHASTRASSRHIVANSIIITFSTSIETIWTPSARFTIFCSRNGSTNCNNTGNKNELHDSKRFGKS